MNYKLTKQDLETMEIRVEIKDGQVNIYHKGKLLRLNNAVSHHKYGKDNVYKIVGFSYHGKPQIKTVQQVVYAWFKGDVPQNMDIDHIDNNPMNNLPENLQLLTRKENLRKRGHGSNQYTCRWTDEQREKVAVRKNISKTIKVMQKELTDYYHTTYNELDKVKEEIRNCDSIKHVKELRIQRNKLKLIIASIIALKKLSRDINKFNKATIIDNENILKEYKETNDVNISGIELLANSYKKLFDLLYTADVIKNK